MQDQPELDRFIRELMDEPLDLDTDRHPKVADLAAYLRRHLAAERPMALVFICTHNSRRSQMAQVWAQIAAAHFGIPKLTAYSGGTEVTAFHPNAVAALRSLGVAIQRTTDSENPRYAVTIPGSAHELTLFSKRFDADTNPREGFCAVMTCTQADESCPFVAGAETRIPLDYEDPKVSDGTPEAPETYRACSRRIARELFFAFRQATAQPR